MAENLYWTEKIKLGTIRDPLQLAVFRFPDQYFLTGITTQTQRLRYYTFVTWAWNQIQEKNSDPKKMLDVEKILSLVSANHHWLDLAINKETPVGMRNITTAIPFLHKHRLVDKVDEYEQLDLDKFTKFGIKNKVGYGDNYYHGPLANLNVLWKEDNDITVSPAGKEISTIFSEHMGKTAEKIWSKIVQLSEIPSHLCCCSISLKERNFWKNVFFGLTTLNKDGGIEIEHGKQPQITDPDKLSFKKFTNLSEYNLDMPEDEEDDIALDDSHFEDEDYKTTTVMRQGTLFMLLEIIKNSKPSNKLLKQTIRDCIYYSQFQDKDKISPINFNKLEPYIKYWEVYVHNLYYVAIFEKTLSIILDISKQKATGIEIDELVSRIDSGKFLTNVKKIGLPISDSDSVQTAYKKLKDVLGGSKTSLSSKINEYKILEMIRKTDDNTESVGLIFILFLLCKYRYSFFNEKQKLILSYEEDKFQNIHPKTRYEKFSDIPAVEFPEHLLKFVIKRHRRVAAKKFINNDTKAWLFTVEEDFLYFNEDYSFKPYRDAKWNYVLEIMSDLGLIRNNSDEERWEITEEGKDWLKKIQ